MICISSFFCYYKLGCSGNLSFLIYTRISLTYVDSTSNTCTPPPSWDFNLGKLIFRGPCSISHDVQIEIGFIYKSTILLVINMILFAFFNIYNLLFRSVISNLVLHREISALFKDNYISFSYAYKLH